MTDLKINPGKVVKHVHEAAEEERAFMRAVVAGLNDLESGEELSLEDAKARLGL